MAPKVIDPDSPVRTQPAIVPTQDILIEIRGYNNIGESGILMAQEEKTTAALFNNETYLKFHSPVEVVIYRGGEKDKSPVQAIQKRLDVLVDADTQTAPVGRVLIHGGSSGGRNVLEVVRYLRKKEIDLAYVAIWDGAFQKDDLIDQAQYTPANLDRSKPATLRFTGLGAKMNEGVVLDNFFQSWGHCLDPKQELHGAVDGFAQTDLTNYPTIVAVKVALDANFIETGSDRQKALEGAHVACYSEGRDRALAKISHKIKQLPLD